MKTENTDIPLPPRKGSAPAGQTQPPPSQHLASSPAGPLPTGDDADVELLRATPPPEPGPYFATRVMAEVRLAQRERGRGWFAWSRALGSVVGGLLVIAGLGVGAIIGHGLASGRSTESAAYADLGIGETQPAFADAFETALAGD